MPSAESHWPHLLSPAFLIKVDWGHGRGMSLPSPSLLFYCVQDYFGFIWRANAALAGRHWVECQLSPSLHVFGILWDRFGGAMWPWAGRHRLMALSPHSMWRVSVGRLEANVAIGQVDSVMADCLPHSTLEAEFANGLASSISAHHLVCSPFPQTCSPVLWSYQCPCSSNHLVSSSHLCRPPPPQTVCSPFQTCSPVLGSIKSSLTSRSLFASFPLCPALVCSPCPQTCSRAVLAPIKSCSPQIGLVCFFHLLPT